MQVSAFDQQGILHTFERAKEPFRLKNLDSRNRNILKSDMLTIVDILQTMRMLADHFQPQYRIVATEAVRSSNNSQALLAMVADALRLPLEIIDGLEEARLSHLGMARILSDRQEKNLFIDLGGGSTEIIIGDGQTIDYATSLKMGGATLSRTIFAPSHESLKAKLETFKWRFDIALSPIRAEVGPLKCHQGVITAGTGKAVARIHHHIAHGFLPDDVHAYHLTHDDIDEVCRVLRTLQTPKKIRAAFPIDAKRSEVILAGAEIFRRISKEFGIPNWQVSTFGLREGIMIDSYQRQGLLPEQIKKFPRTATVKQWAKRFYLDANYAEHMERLASHALEQLLQLPLHLPRFNKPLCQQLIGTAGYLYEIGKFISFSGYHKHSYYILSEANIFGFTQLERNLLGLAILFSRKKRSPMHVNRQTKPPYLDLYQKEVNLMACALRIARCLNRSRRGPIDTFTIEERGGQIVLSITGDPEVLKVESYCLDQEISLIGKGLGLPFTYQIRKP